MTRGVRGLLLVWSAVAGCADEHGARAEEPSPEPDAFLDVPRTDADAQAIPIPEASVDCAEAGAPLFSVEPWAPRERMCLRPSSFVDRNGRAHPIRDGGGLELSTCPLPDELSWPGGGESCWYEPLCNAVETSASEGDAGFECCYQLQRRCGV